MPPCVRLLVTWNALILVSHVSALGVLNDAKNNSPSCSFQGLVRTYLHDAPVDISTSLPLRTFTQDLAAAALPTSDPNRKSSSLDFSTDQAGSALAILQDSTTRRRLMNIDVSNLFTNTSLIVCAGLRNIIKPKTASFVIIADFIGPGSVHVCGHSRIRGAVSYRIAAPV